MPIRGGGRNPRGGVRARRLAQRLSMETVSGPSAIQSLQTIASAATIDVSGVGDTVVITGTTQIDAIADMPQPYVPGAKKLLQFTGALQLTYSAGLLLPGAANITTAPGDTAWANWDGPGVWRLSPYMLADGTILGVVPIVKGGTGETTAVEGKDALTVQSADIPSAAPDLATATGEAVTITGTTTITALGTVSAGAKRVLTFAGALTLTHHATSLILPTGANITTAAGDVAVMISLGAGNWKCVTYTRANGQVLTTVTLSLGGTGATTAVGAGDNLSVQGADVPSAATTDLAAATGDFVVVTGTVTITALGTAAAGVERTVKFAGALTLTYNAVSLILPTAANILTAAGDRAIFRSLGSGNWLCILYTLADGTILTIVPITKGGTGQVTSVTGKDALTTQSSNIASAATTDLSTATGELAIITGTTTITSFGTSPAGVERAVFFQGVLILTSNANIILPGNRTVITSSGDTAVFRSFGAGVWHCMSYKRNGSSLASTSLNAPARRLTATTGVPVTTTDQTAVTTIYSTPYLGSWIPYEEVLFTYDSDLSIGLTQTITGTTVNTSTTITGLSSTLQLMRGMTVTGTGIPGACTITTIPTSTSITISPAATASGTVSLTFKIPASTNVDIWGVTVNQVLALRFGNLWTSDTARADTIQAYYGGWTTSTTVNAADANTFIDGVLLGTIRTTATAGQTEDSEAKRFVWNAYNRVPRKLRVIEATDSWTYASATWRQARATATNQIEIVVGDQLDVIQVKVACISNAQGKIGVGVNSVTAISGTVSYHNTGNVNDTAVLVEVPRLGYSYYAWLEASNTGTVTFNGDIGNAALWGNSEIGAVHFC